VIPQISVLDSGGQYCHLIARRVREMGVYADVHPSDVAPEVLAGRKGILISGGPASVYAEGSPRVEPGVFALGIPVLGICYGQQIMAHTLGGTVTPGVKGEYGPAEVRLLPDVALFAGAEAQERVWMSHRDQVTALPPGFVVTATNETCPIAGMADPDRHLYSVQFHPEVVHTPKGQLLLENFVQRIAGASADWDPTQQVAATEADIRRAADGRKVFFFVSGGVDSSVAFTMCVRALGAENVHAAYVDTGLMREGETDFVRGVLEHIAGSSFEVVDARTEFLSALQGVVEPEAKRGIIGELFVTVQERILNSGRYLDGGWVLGQGTIYPDTIESGGTAKADLIKTHHNRVAGVQRLMEAGLIVEPLTQFYKDEVRMLGRTIGLPDALLDRHPFPGPGLGIRCLGAESDGVLRELADGFVAPLRSVGVQGDSRTYRSALVVDGPTPDLHEAADLPNRLSDVNRVIWRFAGARPQHMKVWRSGLTPERVELLRRADAIVRRLSLSTGFEDQVWQFPVVLVPMGTETDRDSLILRPIHSIDGMTAEAVLPPLDLLHAIEAEVMPLGGIACLLCDLTHKPPGTIEWE
jgi:GMP synthase (glutamine-hydrolysing)